MGRSLLLVDFGFGGGGITAARLDFSGSSELSVGDRVLVGGCG